MLRLELDYNPQASLALQQNAVPFIHRLQLTNTGSQPVRDAVLELNVPGLSLPWQRDLPCLGPGQSETLGKVDLRLSAEALVAVVETVRTDLAITVRGLLEETRPFEVLAYNQWTGPKGLPELLAAFVLPNHPGLQRLLKGASRFLFEWTGDPSLEGYQSRQRSRVRLLAAALYAATQELGLTYVGVPASFEKSGQKIRTPDQILDSGMGDCLDLTCLLAAGLEQMGLHPVLVLLEGHAQVGVWLEEESHPASIIDDASALRKSVELGLLSLFEATGAAQALSFDAAEKVVLDDRFHYAIDVRSARAMGIRPLPLRLTSEGAVALLVEEPAAPVIEAPAPQPESSPWSEKPKQPKEPWEKRLERWKNRLLDLSLRNRLLNFREGGKTTLPLLCPEPTELFEGLAGGKNFTLRGRPRTLDANDPRSPQLAIERGEEDPVRAELRENLKRRDLNTDLSSEELSRRLPEIVRVARTSVEETGARILYLAFGFLRWYETPQAETARFAPLLLIPVDIQRGALGESYKLKLADEEIRPNITLLQKLEREFRLDTAPLYEIPELEGESDVAAYFLRVQGAVLNMPRWEVCRDRVRLGLFSFSKLLMWMDLESSQAGTLLQSLLEGGHSKNTEPLLTPNQLDRERRPQDCHCVVDADSSQLSAVVAAEGGHSFVLQGPPGTGKSQTITNLIADNLARGRSVLFVAEKLAALQVVHSRLSEVGLDPFCLELHSNKASKADVVRQLKEVVELAREAPPESWAGVAGELGLVREQLNDYVAAIHRARPLGWTVFEATARLMELEDAPIVSFPPVGEGSPDLWQRCHKAIQALALTEVGVPGQHLWRDSHLLEWDRSRLIRDVEVLTRCQAAIAPVEEASQRLLAELELATADLDWLHRAARHLLDSPYPTEALLQGDERVAEWCLRGRRRQELWRQLEQHFRPQVLGMDVQKLLALYQKWANVMIVGWIMLWGARRRLARAVQRKLLEVRPLMAALEQALEVQQLDGYFEAQSQEIPKVLGRIWQGAETDWNEVERQSEWAAAFRQLGETKLRSCALQEADNPIGLWHEFHSAYGALLDMLERLRIQFRLPERWVLRPEELREWIADRLTKVPWLREWAHYRRCETEARQVALEPLVEAHWAGRVEGVDLRSAFERGYLESWVQGIYAQEKVLSRFSGAEQRQHLAHFQQLDEQLITLTRRKLRADLAARMPNPQAPVTAGSEVSVLRREMVKKRSHLPPRRLFQQIQNLLPRLKPCVLMSPLSVAQYLDPSLPPFDLVIFDEASQISPWDAVGVLTRARQCIVVGDSKQLPPTSFFERAEHNEDREGLEDEEEMLDSILDECQGSGLPQLSLLWHYRSRNEDLITFSNRRYYEGKLLTFPSSRDERGVMFRYVPEGRFDRGQTRTNQAEAEAVVKELVARLRNPEESRFSYGVVTFNLQQQQLIEHLLEQQRIAHPQIERFFSGPDSVFVKNLENVQGDERDVILFSIAYGPDRLGRLYMNFGPLNQQGGPRRLNVAVSRARHRMLVFSSLRADQIDLSRTNQPGVRDLKSFLAFAERGVEALDADTHLNPEAEYESPFEEQVGKSLEERGWELHRQVGCSGYRIDLAILHPHQRGSYLAAVECDGATYHSAATARDRDRLREMVLRRLGWQVERVWSTDWWQEPQRELKRLDERLQLLLCEGHPLPRRGGGWGEGNEVVAPAVVEDVVVLLDLPLSVAKAYEEAELPTISEESAQLFKQAARVRQLALHLVSVEAPITVDRAVRRLASCWGIRRIGQRTHRFLADQLHSLPGCQVVGEVVWTCDPADYRQARRFDPLDLPAADVANGLELVLRDAVAVSEVDLVKGGARFFGLARAGKNVEACLRTALDRLVEEGRAVRQGEVVRLP